MSSGRQEIKLDELISRSDAILLVKKANPYLLKEKIPYPDEAEGDFEAIAYAFKVVSVVSDADSLVKPGKLKVFSANTEDNFKQTVNHMRAGPWP